MHAYDAPIKGRVFLCRVLVYNCYSMATYKVIQDIEAEDKLIGPLTLRQFIYAGIAAVFLYLSYLVTTRGAGFMVAFFLPVALFSGFLAFPWGRDQPTEVWALAKIRFMLKPRRRIWDQSGAKELVTITAPKHLAVNYTNNLSQDEVRSRLQALANTIDTRGWAVKNAVIDTSQTNQPDESDRLVGPTLLPKPVQDSDIRASDDILDEQNNASAQRLQSMIDQSTKEHRSKILENLNKPQTPDQPQKPAADYWFLNQPAQAANIPKNMVTFNTKVVAPGADDQSAAVPVADEASIVADLEAHKQQSEGAFYGHMHTIQPLSVQNDQQHAAVPPPTLQDSAQTQPAAASQTVPAQDNTLAPQNANAPVTPAGRTAILQLANNDDLNVATIAREAERSAPQNEVVIKLH